VRSRHEGEQRHEWSSFTVRVEQRSEVMPPH
jgi:hypothetical protein